MDTELRGKTALVTGGTSGIGLAIAQELAAEGASVAIASREAESEATARELIEQNAAGGRVVSIQADVSREEDVIRMIAQTIQAFGHLDIFVNNAARALHQPITRIDSITYRTILDTNLSACLWACREIAKHMIPRRTGSILVVGSTSIYTPGPGETVYRITKYGLKSIVESLSVELAPYRIRANLLVPGHFRTRLTDGIPAEIENRLKQNIPLRRFGATQECAKSAAFLLSDALSPYTTGAELVVDGGLSLRPLYFGTDDELRGLNSAV